MTHQLIKHKIKLINFPLTNFSVDDHVKPRSSTLLTCSKEVKESQKKWGLNLIESI